MIEQPDEWDTDMSQWVDSIIGWRFVKPNLLHLHNLEICDDPNCLRSEDE